MPIDSHGAMNRPRPRSLLALLTFLAPLMTQAAVPAFIPYSGRLSDGTAWGQSTTLDLVLTLYNSDVGGTVVFQGKHQGSQVVDGYFTVNLGMCDDLGVCQPNPANATFPAQLPAALWLGVSVDGRPEMARVPVGSVPYAVRCSDAGTLAGEQPAHYATAASVADLGAELNADYYTAAALDDGAIDGRYVDAAGDSMNGALTLPEDGLSVGLGGSQLIVKNGNVGLGVFDPTHQLHLSGTMRLNDSNAIDFFNAAGDAYLGTIYASTLTERFYIHAGINHLWLGSQGIGRDISFNTNEGAWMTRMSIKSSGKIGIGTTDPTKLLDVNGDARVSGTLFAGCETVTGASSANVSGPLQLATSCPNGKTAIGGGASCAGYDQRITESYPNGAQWIVYVYRTAATSCTGYAICCRFGN